MFGLAPTHQLTGSPPACPANRAALEIAEVAAVLRELVEIVLLESSRAATSFARAFGHDFAT